MKLEWAIKDNKTNEIIRGLTEKEIRILLRIRQSHAELIEVYKLGWPYWKIAKDIEFSTDDLFEPTACPQLPPNYKLK